MVDVRLNGEKTSLPGMMTIERLLEHLEMPTKRVAIEVNKAVVRRAEWNNTEISQDDVIEIVHFVGGG